ncbi:MAG: hypothetical protein QOH12_143 [Solirubrobacteraceae bacterium]|jgi:hypothetical protein|nr:hypothetical protein [Solirubrobacteraceae bacterium]
MTDWCPFAKRSEQKSAGPFTGGGHKIVHHSTDGPTPDGAIPTFAANHDWPHFLDAVVNGTYVVWQFVPLSQASSSLRHPAGSGETNHDNCIQIEHTGFAVSSSGWSPVYLQGIARLCRWIEQNFAVPCKAPFPFGGQGHLPARLDWAAWHAASGHLGHQHVPFNDHTDPGAMNIAAVLGGDHPHPPPPPHPPHATHPFPGVLKNGDRGPGVKELQHGLHDLPHGHYARLVPDGDFGAMTEVDVKQFQASHHLTVDGVVGPSTWAAIFPA